MKKQKWEVEEHGDTMGVDIWYPEREPPTYVQVGLIDVRAADSIRIHYDFERNGWSVQQASRFRWEDGEDPDPEWVEVSFVRAWGSSSGFRARR